MGASLIVTIAIVLQTPASPAIKDYEKQNEEMLARRRELEAREQAFATCPIRWQDGPVNGIAWIGSDDEASRFVAYSSDRSLWLGDGEGLRFQARLCRMYESGSVFFSRDGERRERRDRALRSRERRADQGQDPARRALRRRVRALRDARADRHLRRAVQRLRERFLQRAREQDTIVVFVAGHGVRTDSNEYWFLTSDATPADPYAGIDRASLERLVTWDHLRAARRVLLLDTCFSGGTLDQATRGVTSIVSEKDLASSAARKEGAEIAESERKGVDVLAASSDHELAHEQGGNGLFTAALLHGLDGEADRPPNGNGDGFVTIDELQRFAAAEVHEWSGGAQETTQARVEAGEGFRIARVRAQAKGER